MQKSCERVFELIKKTPCFVSEKTVFILLLKWNVLTDMIDVLFKEKMDNLQYLQIFSQNELFLNLGEYNFFWTVYCNPFSLSAYNVYGHTFRLNIKFLFSIEQWGRKSVVLYLSAKFGIPVVKKKSHI